MFRRLLRIRQRRLVQTKIRHKELDQKLIESINLENNDPAVDVGIENETFDDDDNDDD